MGDQAFLSVLMSLAYAFGAGVTALTLKLVGFPLGVERTVWLVLLAPPLVALLAEVATGRWSHTPGTLGLGGLWVVFPLLLAGLSSGAVAGVGRHLLPDSPQTWAGLALGCSLLSLGLWRYWPAPAARLW